MSASKLVSVCRLHKQKNLPMSLEVIFLLKDKFPNIHLDIYGDGELKDYIEKEIFDRLEQFCEDSGQSKTVAVERALDGYFRQYYQNTQMDETSKGIISNCEDE